MPLLSPVIRRAARWADTPLVLVVSTWVTILQIALLVWATFAHVAEPFRDPFSYIVVILKAAASLATIIWVLLLLILMPLLLRWRHVPRSMRTLAIFVSTLPILMMIPIVACAAAIALGNLSKCVDSISPPWQLVGSMCDGTVQWIAPVLIMSLYGMMVAGYVHEWKQTPAMHVITPQCVNCGYSLIASDSLQCSECGWNNKPAHHED